MIYFSLLRTETPTCNPFLGGRSTQNTSMWCNAFFASLVCLSVYVVVVYFLFLSSTGLREQGKSYTSKQKGKDELESMQSEELEGLHKVVLSKRKKTRKGGKEVKKGASQLPTPILFSFSAHCKGAREAQESRILPALYAV